MASPKQARPPLGFTGMRPPSSVAPARSSASASPSPHSPMFSYQSSSSAVDRSYTSASDRSSGPMPASSYAVPAIESLKVRSGGGTTALESVAKSGSSRTVCG